jgi:hypothetical protein
MAGYSSWLAGAGRGWKWFASAPPARPLRVIGPIILMDAHGWEEGKCGQVLILISASGQVRIGILSYKLHLIVAAARLLQ